MCCNLIQAKKKVFISIKIRFFITCKYWSDITFVQNNVWCWKSKPDNSISSISSFCKWNNLQKINLIQQNENNSSTLFDQRMQQQDDYHNDYRFLKPKFLEKIFK